MDTTDRDHCATWEDDTQSANELRPSKRLAGYKEVTEYKNTVVYENERNYVYETSCKNVKVCTVYTYTTYTVLT